MVLRDKYHDLHYSEMGVQPIEVMQAILSKTQFIGFLYGNVVKYHLRAGHKDGESYRKDLEKRDRYLQWLYCAWILGNYINPKALYPKPPIEFISDVINCIDHKVNWLKKCQQIINSGRAEE